MPTPDILRRSLLNAPVQSLADALRRAEPLGELAKDALLTREQAQEIVEKALKLSKADAVEVSVNSGYQGNVRFAANTVSTSGGIADVGFAVQSSFGPKHAVVTSNDLSDESIRRCVEQSERLAKLAPDDPEAMPELPPQQYDTVSAFFESTANLSPADRAKAALAALELARAAQDLRAAG